MPSLWKEYDFLIPRPALNVFYGYHQKSTENKILCTKIKILVLRLETCPQSFLIVELLVTNTALSHLANLLRLVAAHSAWRLSTCMFASICQSFIHIILFGSRKILLFLVFSLLIMVLNISWMGPFPLSASSMSNLAVCSVFFIDYVQQIWASIFFLNLQ